MVHLSVEAYCVLCRQAFDFIWDSRNQQFQNPTYMEGCENSINTDLFCFFDFPDTVQVQLQVPSTGFLFRVDMRSGNWKLRNESVCRMLCENRVDLCSDESCSSCRPGICDAREDMLGFCHPDCLRLAQRTLGHLDGAQLIKIAQIFRHVASWSVISSAFHFELPLLLPDLSDICFETSLAALLHRIKNRFPPELTLQVLGQLSGLPKYMLAAKAAIVYLGHYPADLTTTGSTVQSFEETVSWGQLGIHTNATLGGSCISRLEPSSSTSTVSTGRLILSNQSQVIDSFQVSFGIYGVVDLRLVYRNGTTSDWLSDSKQRWVKNYRVCDLAKIETESDGIKLVDIRLKGNQSPDLLRLLWDTDTPTSPSCRSVFFVLNPRKLAIRSGPGYRLARYLPLDNIRNLTLCFGSAGPHCVQADNGARSALGLKEDMFCFSKETGRYFVPYQSCVTYFLAPDEVITSMCVLTSKDKMSERGVDWPFIVALTSMHRTLCYAPYLLLRQPTNLSSFATAPTKRFCGLFTDPVSPGSSVLGSIGATYEVKDDLCPGVDDSFSIPNPHHPIPHSINDWDECSGFLNIANFSNVSIIELQKRRERYIGLKITRHSGAIDVLGQWDGSVQETITTIYEASQGPLRTLDFKVTNVNVHGMYSWVCLIDVNRPGPAGDPYDSFRVDTLDADVAWYFNQAGDHVDFWDGTMSHYEMPRSSFLDAIQVQ